MCFKNLLTNFKKASVCPAAVRSSWPTEKYGVMMDVGPWFPVTVVAGDTRQV